MKPPHYEIILAKYYYSHGFATGSVVLMNGSILFHGTTVEARKLYNKKTK
jgi:hypothetical protein